MSSTTRSVIGNAFINCATIRNFHCHRAFVEGGKHPRERFIRFSRHGVLRKRRALRMFRRTSTASFTHVTASAWMFRNVCASDFTVNPSFFDPGSMPTAISCLTRADGSRFNRTQKMPRRKNGVASPRLTHRRARPGVVGINGAPSAPTTGT